MVALVIFSLTAFSLVAGLFVYVIRVVRDTYREANTTLMTANGAMFEEVRRANDRAERAQEQAQDNAKVLGETIRESVTGIVEVIGKNAAGPMPNGDNPNLDDGMEMAGFGLGDEEDWTTGLIEPVTDRNDVPVIEPGAGIPGITVPDLSGEKL